MIDPSYAEVIALDPIESLATSAHLRGVVKEDVFTFRPTGATTPVVWDANGLDADHVNTNNGTFLCFKKFKTSDRIIQIDCTLNETARGGQTDFTAVAAQTFGLTWAPVVDNAIVVPLPKLLCAGPSASAANAYTPLGLPILSSIIGANNAMGSGRSATFYPYFLNSGIDNVLHYRSPCMATSDFTAGLARAATTSAVALCSQQDNISASLKKLAEATTNVASAGWLNKYYIPAQYLYLGATFLAGNSWPAINNPQELTFTVKYVETQLSESIQGNNYMSARPAN
jgi:hypothetical protein